MKLKIDKIYRNDRGKDGNPFVNKKGEPFTKINIVANGEYYSGFESAATKGWAEGDTVDVIIEEREWNGKIYKNFKPLGKAEQLESKTSDLEERIKRLEDKVFGVEPKPQPPINMQEPRFDDSDIPF